MKRKMAAARNLFALVYVVLYSHHTNTTAGSIDSRTIFLSREFDQDLDRSPNWPGRAEPWLGPEFSATFTSFLVF